MDDKISVIMACYNCEKTVAKAIDSVLAQTYTNWVMICCDDGSSDGTLRILQQYKEKYPNKFVVIQNEKNSYLPYSLNHCLEYVETDLVARMDADDWILPEKFKIQVDFLKAHPEYVLVGTGVTVWSEKENKKMASIIKEPEPTKETMFRMNAFSHASIMTYKSVYDSLGGYSLDPSVLRVEDLDLWFRFLAAGYKGYNLPDELYIMVENDDAVKRRTMRNRINGAKTACRGYKLLGFKGIKCYTPYLAVFKYFIPLGIYKKIHKWKLNHSDRT